MFLLQPPDHKRDPRTFLDFPLCIADRYEQDRPPLRTLLAEGPGPQEPLDTEFLSGGFLDRIGIHRISRREIAIFNSPMNSEMNLKGLPPSTELGLYDF